MAGTFTENFDFAFDCLKRDFYITSSGAVNSITGYIKGDAAIYSDSNVEKQIRVASSVPYKGKEMELRFTLAPYRKPNSSLDMVPLKADVKFLIKSKSGKSESSVDEFYRCVILEPGKDKDGKLNGYDFYKLSKICSDAWIVLKTLQSFEQKAPLLSNKGIFTPDVYKACPHEFLVFLSYWFANKITVKSGRTFSYLVSNIPDHELTGRYEHAYGKVRESMEMSAKLPIKGGKNGDGGNKTLKCGLPRIVLAENYACIELRVISGPGFPTDRNWVNDKEYSSWAEYCNEIEVGKISKIGIEKFLDETIESLFELLSGKELRNW